MGSALSSNIMPPPAPNPTPNPQGGGQSALGGMMPQGGAPQPQQGGGPPDAQGAQQGQQNAPAPPGFGQTVAALRHFMIMQREIGKLLKDPETGKSDIRSQVIDLATRMVGDGITTPADAVKQLSQFPDKPFDQKQALETTFQQLMQAEDTVLDHHRMGYGGQPVSPDEKYDADSHTDIMSGLTSHYSGKKSA